MVHRLVTEGLQCVGAGPFDLAVESGQCLAVVGPSGAGKSRLLRMLADLIPHEGKCRLDGVDMAAIPAPRWRRQVRYCAAEPGWWEPTIGAHFTNPGWARQNCPQLGLDARLMDAPPEQASTGERQRFALLRGMEDNPAFLLLDEPSSALDEASTALLEQMLEAARRQGKGLVLASHDRGQVARLADNVLEIGKP